MKTTLVNRWLVRGALPVLAALLALVLVGCCMGGGDDTNVDDRWEEEHDKGKAEPAADGTKADKAAEPKPVDGSSFNSAFPDDGTEGATRTFTQEKRGYAEAKYNKEGKEVIKISISDTANNPKARSKFASASDKVSSYPMVTQGKNSSVVLVVDRFQVKATSKTLSPEQRRTWLGQVKFSKLARIK